MAIIHFADHSLEAFRVTLCLLKVRLERLSQLRIARVLDHALQTLHNLVLRGEQIAKLQGVKRLEILDLIRCKQTHENLAGVVTPRDRSAGPRREVGAAGICSSIL